MNIIKFTMKLYIIISGWQGDTLSPLIIEFWSLKSWCHLRKTIQSYVNYTFSYLAFIEWRSYFLFLCVVIFIKNGFWFWQKLFFKYTNSDDHYSVCQYGKLHTFYCINSLSIFWNKNKITTIYFPFFPLTLPMYSGPCSWPLFSLFYYI